MGSQVVVMLGVTVHSEVADALLAVDYTPLERAGVERTVATLRRERVAGVLVNVERCRLDVLELLLNIRDVAPDLPVALIAGRTSFEKSLPMMEDFPNTTLLSESLPAEGLVLTTTRGQIPHLDLFRELIIDLNENGEALLDEIFVPLVGDRRIAVPIVATCGLPVPYDAWTAR